MPAATTAPELSLPPFNPAGARVLVVDDDRVNLRILRGILEKAGYGEEALTRRDTFQPDLVLLDVILPGMDGFATCRELQSRHRQAAPP